MNDSVHTLTFYLYPLIAQVALSYVVAASILVTRMSDLAFNSSSTVKFYEDYSGTGGPPLVQRTTSQLSNLFEFPVLFFVLICIVISAGFDDSVMKTGAWVFVGGRWTHTLVHLFMNRLWFRTPVFMVSNLVLLAMWGRLVYLALG